jgi:hypothetical protein
MVVKTGKRREILSYNIQIKVHEITYGPYFSQKH